MIDRVAPENVRVGGVKDGRLTEMPREPIHRAAVMGFDVRVLWLRDERRAGHGLI